MLSSSRCASGQRKRGAAPLCRICSDTRRRGQVMKTLPQELKIQFPQLDSDFTSSGRGDNDAMTVVFSTYHSLGHCEQAQDAGAPHSIFILCDEAHRTTVLNTLTTDLAFCTGTLERENSRDKRLYMTATPASIPKAPNKRTRKCGSFSMDDPAPMAEVHRCPFSRASSQIFVGL